MGNMSKYESATEDEDSTLEESDNGGRKVVNTAYWKKDNNLESVKET